MTFLMTDFKRELLLLINKAYKGGGVSAQEIADTLHDVGEGLDEILNPEPPVEPPPP
jgi:hypothetical protein